jgi:cell division protein FtsB
MKTFTGDKTALYRNVILGLVLLCVALITHEIFGPHGYLELRRQQKEMEVLQQQIQQLRQENEELDRQIKALKSDPRAVERLAREQMHMARPGELIYVLPETQLPKGHLPPHKETPAK